MATGGRRPGLAAAHVVPRASGTGAALHRVRHPQRRAPHEHQQQRQRQQCQEEDLQGAQRHRQEQNAAQPPLARLARAACVLAAASAASLLAPAAAAAAAAPAAPLDWVAARLLVYGAAPVVGTMVLVCMFNALARRAEVMPNPDGLDFADVAPRALRGPAVGALVALLALRLTRNFFIGLDAFRHTFRPTWGAAHDMIDPLVETLCQTMVSLDSVFVRVCGAVAILFAAWGAVELKQSLVGMWLQSGTKASADATVDEATGELRGQTAADTAQALSARELERTVVPLSMLSSWIISGVGLMLALNCLGINVVPLLTVGGAGTVVLGLASQQLLSNAVNGVSIFFSRPFVAGEVVTLQGTGGVMVSGTVISVTPMRTVVRDVDGFLVSLPNKTVSDMVIYNRSRSITTIPKQLGAVIRQPLRLRLKLGAGTQVSALGALQREVGARLVAGTRGGVVERGSGAVALGKLTDGGIELLVSATLLVSEFGLNDARARPLVLDINSIAAGHGAACTSIV